MFAAACAGIAVLAGVAVALHYIPAGSLALEGYSQAAATPYYSGHFGTSDGGYPNPLTVNNIYAQSPGYAVYGCGMAYCNQVRECSDPLTAVISVSDPSGATGKASRVSSHDNRDSSPGTFYAIEDGSVRLEWACQPYVRILMYDGSRNYCPYYTSQTQNYANNVVVSGPDGVIYSGTSLKGSAVVSVQGEPGDARTYAVQCKQGTANAARTDVSVIVSGARIGLSASPATVAFNEASTLSWNVTGTNLTSCTLAGPSGVLWSGGPTTVSFSNPGTQTYTVPTHYTSIVAKVSGAGGGGGGGAGFALFGFSNGSGGGIGGASSFNGTLVGNGGGGGGGGTGGGDGSHGTASGGDTNVTGGGSSGSDGGQFSGGRGGNGGIATKTFLPGELSGAVSVVVGAGGGGGSRGSGLVGGWNGSTGVPGKVELDIFPVPITSMSTGPLTVDSEFSLTCIIEGGSLAAATTSVRVAPLPLPVVAITGKAGGGPEQTGVMEVEPGTVVTIEGTYAPGAGDTLTRTALNDAGSNPLPGVSNATAASPKQYTFNAQNPGTYVFYPAVQTLAHPAWNDYGKSLTVVVLDESAPTCTSAQNACGMTNLGGIVAGVCNALPPPNSSCPPPAITFTASPERVRPGQASTLSWSATNATDCRISGDLTESGVGLSGTRSTGPVNITRSYVLTCQNGPGGSEQSATVRVTLIPTVREI